MAVDIKNFDAELNLIDDLVTLNELRVKYLGKKGLIANEMQKIAQAKDKKAFGQEINEVKQYIEKTLNTQKAKLEEKALDEKLLQEKLDITLPARETKYGKVHPTNQATEELIAILGNLGFSVKEGPNIEDDWYNFTSLNIAEHHPARQMFDTFYMDGSEKKLLRTHTSPVQIRTMTNDTPPFRFISPGRTYRCDSDMTHTPMFHQIEGVLVDKNINFAHLKYIIIELVKAFFENDDLPVRFRPSYFPFTEPSAEVDIGCIRENGELKIGPGKDWLEVLGCGLIHPQVLQNCNIDPEEYQGLAFGIGIERLAMLKYGITDLRNFFDGDKRWIDHYGFSCFDIPSTIKGLTK